MAQTVKPKRGEVGPVNGFGEGAPEIPMIVWKHPVRRYWLSRIPHPCEQRLNRRVHRHPSPLTRFRFVDCDHPYRPLHVLPCQPEEFALTETCVNRICEDGVKPFG